MKDDNEHVRPGGNADVYQRLALRTAPSELDMVMPALGLCGESGKYADLIKKHVYHGHPLDREKALSELSDVAWYLAVAAHSHGVALSEVLAINVRKLQKRYPNGWSSGDSINRTE